MAENQRQHVLEMHGINKSFPGVVALDKVDFELRSSEIHALVGENGAGKSTLIKILGGVYTRDQGEILIDKNPVDIPNPIIATKHGIAIIHQELQIIPGLTVADNVLLGEHPITRFGLINNKELFEKTQQILDELELSLSPKSLVGNLPTAAGQLVLISQALARNPRFLIMDEPTSALGEADIERLFGVIRRLAAQGVGVAYISHKLDEILSLSDRVSVLRDGKLVGTRITQETNRQELVNLMVGRELSDMYPKQSVEIDDKMLEVIDFTVEGVDDPVSFHLRKGEILGLFGLLGAGRTRLMEALFGVRKGHGRILIEGKEVDIKSPIDAFDAGLGLLPLERKAEGLVMSLSIRNNLVLGTLPRYMRFGFMQDNIMANAADRWIDTLQIRCTDGDQITRDLSGGNQQKVVLGRLLESNVKIIILNSPTRGIDVGAKVEIYNLMGELCAQGKGVIFVTSELPELLGLSDRTLVMASGRITGEFSRQEANQEDIMHAAIGEPI